MWLWGGGNKLPVDGRYVVITGASQGMGLEVAKQLAAKGANVAIVARNAQKLQEALTQVTSSAKHPSGKQKFLSVSADFASSAEVERAFEEIVAWAGGAPDITWSCVGYSLPRLFLDTSFESIDSHMRTNYLSAAYTAKVVLKHLNAHAPKSPSHRRHIIFTSSVAALYPVVGYGAYAPTKAALRALTDNLRHECLLYENIDVHCCYPATIFSPSFEIEQQCKPAVTKKLEESDGGQTPQEVARICINRLERGHVLVTTNFIGDALRSLSWGVTEKGFWLWDTLFAAVFALIWPFISWDVDGKVKKWKKEHGPFAKIYERKKPAPRNGTPNPSSSSIPPPAPAAAAAAAAPSPSA
ncbi:hypothetical protein DFH27DRAFT_474960 [Peziza echinospora]|nr:hypothetical protein DFH27DRAFT_474960 [Peziza echinospora]